MPDRYHGPERRDNNRLREIVRESVEEAVPVAVRQTLLAIGINPAHPLEAQNDMAFLRSMRERCEKVGMAGIAAIITVTVGGVLSALWIGFKAAVGK
jgi:hypothetical protein